MMRCSFLATFGFAFTRYQAASTFEARLLSGGGSYLDIIDCLITPFRHQHNELQAQMMAEDSGISRNHFVQQKEREQQQRKEMEQTTENQIGSPKLALQEWTGRIVARFLPPDVEGEYNQIRKPSGEQTLCPSSLRPGTGILQHKPTSLPRLPPFAEAEATVTTTSDLRRAGATKAANAVNNTVSSKVSSLPSSSSWMTFDVYLFCESQDIVTLQLIRRPDEEATKCLQRLELSIAKKLKSFLEPKSNNKDKRKGRHNQISTSSRVWRHPSSSNSMQPQLWDVSALTNEQVWGATFSSDDADPTTTIAEVVMNNAFSIPLLVESNPPTILSVRTYEKFLGKQLMPDIPLFVEVDVAYATDAIVDWYVDGVMKKHDSRSFTPTEDDVGKRVAILITPTRPGHDGTGCHEAYEYSEPVAKAPPKQTLLALREEWLRPRTSNVSDGCDASVSHNNQLRVLSYNVLADQNAFSTTNRMPFFPYVRSEILARDRRLPLVLQELLSYHADVICLQEVDQLVFDTLLRPALEFHNYQGYYSVKQSEGTREGCAMFWSLDRFQRIDDVTTHCKTYAVRELIASCVASYHDNLNGAIESSVEWKDCIEPLAQLFESRPDLMETIQTNLGHVLQLANLTEKDSQEGSNSPGTSKNNQLLVGNTHLFFHPRAAHIRLIQCFAICHQLWLQQQQQQQQQQRSESGHHVPFLFCGDLNTSLEYAGRIMIQKQVPKNYRDLKVDLNSFQWDATTPHRSEEAAGKSEDDFPELRLPNCFPDLASSFREKPEFTHYIDGFKGTLDHVVMSLPDSNRNLGGLRPLRTAPMPTEFHVTCDVAMPSERFPSDHVSVLCELEWCK